jgi:hypothetical protein
MPRVVSHAPPTPRPNRDYPKPKARKNDPDHCRRCGQELGTACPGCGRRRHDCSREKCYLC